MLIIPSIDLRNGQVVRLQQGDYDRQINYSVTAAVMAAEFAAAGAKHLHIVDLDGAREGRPVQTNLIADVAGKSTLQVQVGGGVRSTEDVDRLMAAGAARVVVGTAAMERWDWFHTLVHTPAYAGKIVLALDAKDGIVATRGWTASAGKAAVDVARQVSDWPLAAILYTDVARDGMLTGNNVAETAAMASAGNVRVIASGGIGHIDHIRVLHGSGAWAVIVGRSLYEGKVDLREALAAAGEG